MKSQNLINELVQKTKELIIQTKGLEQMSVEQLNQRPGEGKWSALEAIEHLNYYGDFYTSEIQKRIQKSKRPKSESFKTGKLGNYFAKSVAPNAKGMKTFINMDPCNIGSELNKKVLTNFILHQEKMLELLEESRNHNLTKVKTSITISNLIKLRLGDTFKVVVYHNERHMQQAMRAVSLV